MAKQKNNTYEYILKISIWMYYFCINVMKLLIPNNNTYEYKWLIWIFVRMCENLIHIHMNNNECLLVFENGNIKKNNSLIPISGNLLVCTVCIIGLQQVWLGWITKKSPEIVTKIQWPF